MSRRHPAPKGDARPPGVPGSTGTRPPPPPLQVSAADREAFRKDVSNVLERRLFYIPSFKIYGSVGGFFDFGPPGCALKSNFLQAWRQHFVVEENMLEVECPAVTPEVVLKTSGHVERFLDFMVSDVVNKECYRADHLLEATLEALLEDKESPLTPERREQVLRDLAAVEGMDRAELGEKLTEYGAKAPDTGNDITEPFPFNLMFKTSIGPKGDITGYLRPETAQGIFVNFRDLLYYNGNKLPFAAAQIGTSFRNEISPRAGLLRVREFQQAEIEHFLHPENKDHAKFSTVAHLELPLYSRDCQMAEKAADRKPLMMGLGKAVAEGVIANESLGYFIGRTFQFFQSVGVDCRRVRFRQHLAHEMAHYATDCWDGEIETSYGWVECCGLADRSAYDLTHHAEASKVDLSAFEKFDTPQVTEELQCVVNKRAVGGAFKKDAKAVQTALEGLAEPEVEALQAAIAANGSGEVATEAGPFSVTAEHVEIKKVTVKRAGRNFVPSVIEPSFGVGRIIYALFEHSYYQREGQGSEARTVFRFTPLVAPVKSTVFPLLQKEQFNSVATEICADLRKSGLSSIVDTTGASIGKRYARTDEIGVPFAVTVDHQTLADSTVTVRERDSMAQVRVPRSELVQLLLGLSNMLVTWEETQAKYPAQATADE